MKNPNLKIVFLLMTLFIGVVVGRSQIIDTVSVLNQKYDSLLKSSEHEVDLVFYKYQDNQLVNNLGPFGSHSYYNNSFYFSHKRLIEEENELYSQLRKLEGFKPYTNITYINASRKEQQFAIDHYQELAKNVFFDFNFNRLSSPGSFINQEANRTLFYSNLKLKSNKDNYALNLFVNIDRKFFQENGGLTNPTNYENELFDDNQNYEVNLLNSNAFNKNNIYGIEQRIDIFKFNRDSTFISKLYLKHKSSYSRHKKVFYDNDPLSLIYSNLFVDSISYTDSIYSENVNNMAFLGYRNSSSEFEFFAQYDLNKYEQNFGIVGDYHNSYIGSYGKHSFDNFIILGKGKYGLSGYRKGDVDLEIKLKKQHEKYELLGSAYYYLNAPHLKFVSYNSNHFKWNNTSLDKENNIGAYLKYELKKYQLVFEAESKMISDKLFYDSLAQANQHNERLNVSTFSLSKKYKLLNFYFRSAVMYQLTSNEYIVPLPEIVGRQIIYYQKDIFKKALKFQIGFGLSYSTAYYGYAYMPAINEFYTQNHTQLGEYPKLDVFINTRLKRAQIFLKYEHINAGDNLDKAYLVPGYPMLDKSLKFGVSWNMFD